MSKKGLAGSQANEVVSAGLSELVDATELDVVTALRGVIHLSVSGIDSVVAMVVIDNQVTRHGIFWRNNDSSSSLGRNSVVERDSKLCVDEKDQARAVKASRVCPAKYVWGSNVLRCHPQNLFRRNGAVGRVLHKVSCGWTRVGKVVIDGLLTKNLFGVLRNVLASNKLDGVGCRHGEVLSALGLFDVSLVGGCELCHCGNFWIVGISR